MIERLLERRPWRIRRGRTLNSLRVEFELERASEDGAPGYRSEIYSSGSTRGPRAVVTRIECQDRAELQVDRHRRHRRRQACSCRRYHSYRLLHRIQRCDGPVLAWREQGLGGKGPTLDAGLAACIVASCSSSLRLVSSRRSDTPCLLPIESMMFCRGEGRLGWSLDFLSVASLRDDEAKKWRRTRYPRLAQTRKRRPKRPKTRPQSIQTFRIDAAQTETEPPRSPSNHCSLSL